MRLSKSVQIILNYVERFRVSFFSLFAHSFSPFTVAVVVCCFFVVILLDVATLTAVIVDGATAPQFLASYAQFLLLCAKYSTIVHGI